MKSSIHAVQVAFVFAKSSESMGSGQTTSAHLKTVEPGAHDGAIVSSVAIV